MKTPIHPKKMKQLRKRNQPKELLQRNLKLE